VQLLEVHTPSLHREPVESNVPEPGDPNKLAPTTVTFDLSRWAGKKVRIRFAQVDNRGPLRAGVDDVRLAAIGS